MGHNSFRICINPTTWVQGSVCVCAYVQACDIDHAHACDIDVGHKVQWKGTEHRQLPSSLDHFAFDPKLPQRNANINAKTHKPKRTHKHSNGHAHDKHMFVVGVVAAADSGPAAAASETASALPSPQQVAQRDLIWERCSRGRGSRGRCNRGRCNRGHWN